MVNNILDASNLTGDGAALERIDFHLLEMLNLGEEQLIERARGKGLALTREIDPALPPVFHGDPLRIGQVLGNLLDNAVKFSEQGCITLRVRRKMEEARGLMVRFEVEDQGMGIPEGCRELLFENFRQLDDSSTRRFGGCGLGLSICRQLVARMEGSIGFEAVPGGGSVFWFQVPLAPAQGDAGPQLTLAYLRRLLETESLMARTLWGQCRDVLLPLLGQDGVSMEQALEQAELSRALELLGPPMGEGNE
ncbi:ATP-binding protein [Zoogloea sp.]|uniref:ATP-binding protein n=1 Tax=Zoogloea sp. TaxID=49181 RepID=UPI0026353A98|nr:ATP-binding protein [Zoogloea sp.]MDD3353907.1 ATP-binding protein [Zoogloea sp.]